MLLLLVSGELLERLWWLNYPGLELWKFLNLAIFTAAGIFLLRKPISLKLAERRAQIQQELLAAKAEREQALARLAEAEALLSKLNDDVRAIREQSLAEAKTERRRLAA